jgi:hypothetical protein
MIMEATPADKAAPIALPTFQFLTLLFQIYVETGQTSNAAKM